MASSESFSEPSRQKRGLIVSISGSHVNLPDSLPDSLIDVLLDQFSHGPGEACSSQIQQFVSGDWKEFQKFASQNKPYDALFYLDAFPGSLSSQDILSSLRSCLKEEGILYIDLLNGVWNHLILPVQRVLSYLNIRDLAEAEKFLGDPFIGKHLKHAPLRAARDLLAVSPFLFSQYYLTSNFHSVSPQDLKESCKKSGFSFDRWLDDSEWTHNPLKGSKLESDWKILNEHSQMHQLEYAVSPRLRAWFRVAQVSREEISPKNKQTSAYLNAETIIQRTETVSEQVASLYNVHPYPPAGEFFVFDHTRELINLLTYRTPDTIIPRKARILIAGCGTIQGARYAQEFPEATVLAIDMTLASLNIAQKIAHDAGVTNIRFEQHDLTQLETLEGQFDFIICTGVLHHLKDPHQGLRDLSQKLSPNGLIHLMVYNSEHRFGFQMGQNLIFQFPWTAAEREKKAILLLREYSQQTGLFQPYASEGWAMSRDDRISFADTFLHPRERSFSVSELNDWLDHSHLKISSFLKPFEWSLQDVISSPWILERCNQLSENNRHELINLLAPPFLDFFAERKSNGHETSELEISNETLLKSIPIQRTLNRCFYDITGKLRRDSIEPTFETISGSDQVRFFFGDPKIFTVAHKMAQDFYIMIDGKLTIHDIAQKIAERYQLSFEMVLTFALDIFRRFLFRQQMIILQNE